jgi:hypothetical protein
LRRQPSGRYAWSANNVVSVIVNVVRCKASR